MTDGWCAAGVATLALVGIALVGMVASVVGVLSEGPADADVAPWLIALEWPQLVLSAVSVVVTVGLVMRRGAGRVASARTLLPMRLLLYALLTTVVVTSVAVALDAVPRVARRPRRCSTAFSLPSSRSGSWS